MIFVHEQLWKYPKRCYEIKDLQKTACWDMAVASFLNSRLQWESRDLSIFNDFIQVSYTQFL